MKQVLIIAIVAVAMIGMMVPSVFADEYEIYYKFEERWNWFGSINESGKAGEFSYPSFIGIDSKDIVYVLDNGRVQKFTTEGELISVWNNVGRIGGDFNSKDELYMVETKPVYQIIKLSDTGNIIETWGTSDSDDVKIDLIGDMNPQLFIDNSDNLYIGDYKYISTSPTIIEIKVSKYSPDGQLLQNFQNMGMPRAQDEDGNLYAGTSYRDDWSNPSCEIIKYNSMGNPIDQFGSCLNSGGVMAMDSNGNLVVGGGEEGYQWGVISIFDSDGKILASWGGGRNLGEVDHRFVSGIALDSQNKIFFTDNARHSVYVYTPVTPIASFVDQSKDPQHYIDRYFNEPTYKDWFDENYPQYSSIYEAVGADENNKKTIAEYVAEPVVEYTPEPITEVTSTPNCGTGTEEVNGICQVIKNNDQLQNNELDNLKKILPDYYNVDKENTMVLSENITILSATINNDEGGKGEVTLTYYSDNDESVWSLFNKYKTGLDNVRDIGDLDETCYIGLPYVQSPEVKSLFCVKDNVLITATTNNGEEISTMKQIFEKMNDSSSNTNNSNGGGCLIATATYGSEMANEVQQLRELRDNQLLQTESGTAFMGMFNDIYYSFSPIIADYERENPYFKEAVKLAITPMISTLSLMENAESESEVLGIGISVIMLNLGMYLGIPAIVIVGIRKRF